MNLKIAASLAILLPLVYGFAQFLPARIGQEETFLAALPKGVEQKLYNLGVIDKRKVRGELSTLNIFWAFGLANKNPILERGPMMDPRYGGAGNFASTGGWTLAKGNAMDHYSMHQLITLSPEQQQLVEHVSRKVYRPCCKNSAYFPDCNHGMAMLGLLELLANAGADEQTMYAAALKANRLWFGSQYATIERYLSARGSLASTNPADILGPNFSSASGFARILAAAPPKPVSTPRSGSCGV